ncbi:hypothetical protein VKT23_013102 [Stygiomarasmius scandens]|uniref:Uncharacterized protein n=1 Tax=Marasmiellus scandens TaxID=2682957 RepID=A0ABR1J6E0_9AGAR
MHQNTDAMPLTGDYHFNRSISSTIVEYKAQPEDKLTAKSSSFVCIDKCDTAMPADTHEFVDQEGVKTLPRDDYDAETASSSDPEYPYTPEGVVTLYSELPTVAHPSACHGHPTTPHISIAHALATQLDTLPTTPSQSDTRSMMALMTSLEIAAGGLKSRQSEVVRIGLTHRFHHHCQQVEQEEEDREVERTDSITRAIERKWSRSDLGVDPLTTEIPAEHVRDFDNPTKNLTFLIGWADNTQTRDTSSSSRPQFTNPWDKNTVIPHDESDWDSTMETRAFTSTSTTFYRPSSVLSFGGSSCYNSSASLSSASVIRRVRNYRSRESSQMSDLGMEARYSS